MKIFKYQILQIRIIGLPAFSFLLLAFSFFSPCGAQAQQFFTYSQYMNNLTPLNPAYSLLDNNGSINALVRKQWVGIPGAPTTFVFNANLPLESIGASSGLIAMDDQFAVEHLTEINAYFAKSVRLTASDYLAVSLNAGIRRYVANYSNLDPGDPAFNDNLDETKPNLGFGVLLYSDKYYLGVAVPELTVRSLGTGSIIDNNYFRNHYNFSAAYLIDVAEDIDFKPAGLLTYTRGVPVIADVSGTFYLKKMIGFGLDYRSNNEIAGIMSVSLDVFKFGYSYQFGTASDNIGGISFATQELTLTYRFGRHLSEHRLL
jgi:type IX secretion system PorP/SprF family membrane protein